MYAKMKTQGDAGGYDVIAPSNYFVSKMGREGMLQELDHSKLPVIKEIRPLIGSTNLMIKAINTRFLNC